MNLRGAVLRAPFAGVVANLKVKPWEQASGTVCVIIDDGTFDVRFPLLESELPAIAVGRSVAVAPSAGTAGIAVTSPLCRNGAGPPSSSWSWPSASRSASCRTR